MMLVAMVAEFSIVLFGLLLFLFLIAAHEAGHWLGRRGRLRAGGSPETIGVVVGGMLGLLAFVLALTLSFANARFDERRAGTLAEANAISTAWLRAVAIGGPDAEQIASLLERYTRIRADFVAADRGQGATDALNRHSGALQAEIWGHVAAIVHERPDPVSASLMAALNNVFDMSAAERFAFELALPAQLFWLLVGMTALCMGCLGYQSAGKGEAPRPLMALFALMLATVMVEILDLASGRIGEFDTQTRIYEQTLESFEGGIAVRRAP